MKFSAQNLFKRFGRRVIFQNIVFELSNGDSIAFTGKNGSGKSTLVKICAGVLSPTSGTIELTIDGKIISADKYFQYIGFVAPYLQLYDEFSPIENLHFFSTIRGLKISVKEKEELLKRVNLFHRKDDYVRTFSSGMKQRMKFAFALLHNPPILILDEPTTNLDAEGSTMVFQIMEEQKKKGILLLATNTQSEQEHCEKIISLS
ncbi:MAG: ABC transporter ATP-binding protein [Bacteroidota bacterium]